MILSDKDILRELESDQLSIQPFDSDRLQPSSYDLALSERFWTQRPKRVDEVIDLDHPPNMDDIGLSTITRCYTLRPGMFVLGSTTEHVQIPGHLAARLEGKSSLGRLGLIIHATAGYIDPGFRGYLTLELTNVGIFPIRLRVGMAIAQLTLLRMESEPDRLYGHPDLGSRYQNQGPMPVPFRPKQPKVSA